MKKYKSINQDTSINVMIEIMEGDFNKYEYNEETQEIELDRIMQTSMSYPANYGFILNTKGEDGDALDVLIISSRPIIPGVIAKARVIGMLEMEDEGGVDQKIICVLGQKCDLRFAKINSLSDFEPVILEKITHFFEHYKDLEKEKWVKVSGFKDRDETMKLIEKSIIN
jgi:inorganic pyrophosphatase